MPGSMTRDRDGAAPPSEGATARAAGGGPYRLRSQVAGRRETPCPRHNHAHPDPDLALIEGGFDGEVAQVQIAVAGLVHPHGGIGRRIARTLREHGVLYAR